MLSQDIIFALNASKMSFKVASEPSFDVSSTSLLIQHNELGSSFSSRLSIEDILSILLLGTVLDDVGDLSISDLLGRELRFTVIRRSVINDLRESTNTISQSTKHTFDLSSEAIETRKLILVVILDEIFFLEVSLAFKLLVGKTF